VRRSRYIAADPERTTAETVEAIGDLMAGSLPAADKSAIGLATESLRAFASYLVPGEHLTTRPLTLVAGSLACDVFTLHGEDAVGVEDPAPPPGAASETSWTLYVPIPPQAPFAAGDVEKADPHFRAGPAPADAGEAVAKAAEGLSLSDLLSLASRGGQG
jgi:hypothetical protein